MAVRSQHKRLSALEAHIESRVEERLLQELEAVFDRLEKHLTREEFVRVARILAEMDGEE